MPYAVNKGVHIYYETEGQGISLIMQHGTSGSHRFWRDLGYAKELSKDYRLIMLDARGHGKSDKPHDAKAYAFSQTVSDFVAILDDLKLDKAFYMGYSMGGRIGLHIPMYAPGRFHALIIGGAVYPASGHDPAAFDDLGPAFIALEKAIKGKYLNPMEAFVAVSEKNMGPMLPERKAVTLSQDPEAIIAGYHARRQENDPKAVDYLPKIDIPCLLYCGTDDPRLPGVKENARLIPKAAFVPIPGTNHSQTNNSPQLVLPHVEKFLSEVSKNIEYRRN